MDLAVIGFNAAIGFYFGLLIVFISFLSPKGRRYFKLKLRGYEENLPYFIITRQILFFLLPLISSLFIGLSFTQDQLLPLIALGISINVFWVVQLPVLTRAHLSIDFAVDQIKNFDEDINLETDKEHIIYTRIYNMGFSTLKNATFLIYIEKGLVEIVEYSKEKYGSLDFSKQFSLQKCNCGALFPPTNNFQTIPPQEWFIFPLIVKSSKTETCGKITIMLSSESSWGQTKYDKAKIRTQSTPKDHIQLERMSPVHVLNKNRINN